MDGNKTKPETRKIQIPYKGWRRVVRRRTRGNNVISLEGYRKVTDYFVRAGGKRKDRLEPDVEREIGR